MIPQTTTSPVAGIEPNVHVSLLKPVPVRLVRQPSCSFVNAAKEFREQMEIAISEKSKLTKLRLFVGMPRRWGMHADIREIGGHPVTEL
jgi:hypothetical protein